MGRARILGWALASALVFSGCGGQHDVADDPRQALRDAFERMSEWEGATLTLRLDADVEALLAADDSDDLTEEQARAILDGSVMLRSYAGEDLADRSDDEGEFLLETRDTTLLHVQTVGVERLFVRSEVREAVDRFGDEKVAAELDAAEVQAREFGIDFAEDFFTGRWLALTGVEEVSNMYGAMAGVETPEPEEVETFLSELEASIDRLLGEATVESLGSDSAGEHVRVVASAEQLGNMAADMLESVGALMAGQVGLPPGVMADELRRDLADAPAVDIPIDLWLDDGVVRQVGFDLVEFARRNGDLAVVDIPAGVDRFLVLAELDEFGGGIETPGDAIEVDLAELMSRFMGQGFGQGFGDLDGGDA